MGAGRTLANHRAGEDRRWVDRVRASCPSQRCCAPAPQEVRSPTIDLRSLASASRLPLRWSFGARKSRHVALQPRLALPRLAVSAVAHSVASKLRAEPLLTEFLDFISRAIRGDYLGHAQARKAKLALVSDAAPHSRSRLIFRRLPCPERSESGGSVKAGSCVALLTRARTGCAMLLSCSSPALPCVRCS